MNSSVLEREGQRGQSLSPARRHGEGEDPGGFLSAGQAGLQHIGTRTHHRVLGLALGLDARRHSAQMGLKLF